MSLALCRRREPGGWDEDEDEGAGLHAPKRLNHVQESTLMRQEFALQRSKRVHAYARWWQALQQASWSGWLSMAWPRHRVPQRRRRLELLPSISSFTTTKMRRWRIHSSHALPSFLSRAPSLSDGGDGGGWVGGGCR